MGLIRILIFLCLICTDELVGAQTSNKDPFGNNRHIELLFNQDVYQLGDEVHFSVYYFQDDLTSVQGLNYLTVAIFDQKNQIQSSARILVNDGIGSGKIHLNKAWDEGIYTLLAYSNISGSEVYAKRMVLSTDQGYDLEDVDLSLELDEPFEIQLEGLEKEKDNLNLTANSESVAGDIQLVITSNGITLFQTSQSYASGESIIRTIPKQILSRGIHHMMIISDNTVIVDRQFYIPPQEEALVEVVVSDTELSPRENATISLKLKGKMNNEVRGQASVRVINESAFDFEPSSRNDHLFSVLESKNTDRINEYFKHRGHVSILEDSSFRNNTTQYLKRGKAISSTTGEPLPEGAKLLFYFHKSQRLALIQLSEGAEFGFTSVKDVHGTDGMFYTAEDYYGFEIDDVHIEWHEDRVVTPVTMNETNLIESPNQYYDFKKKKNIIDQSFMAFSQEDDATQHETMIDQWETRFLKADKIYDMSKYQIFPTMKETIKEIITPLDVVRYNKKNVIRVNNLKFATPQSTPVYIIDGIATKDTDYMLSMDPSNLREVRIYRNRVNLKKLGFLGRNGVIRIETKSRNAAPPIHKNNMLNAPISELMLHDTMNPSSDAPIFRSAIYWNPILVLSAMAPKSIKLTSTDDISRYRILVNGITDDGLTFQHKQSIEVAH